jgi:beta-xylosidase
MVVVQSAVRARSLVGVQSSASARSVVGFQSMVVVSSMIVILITTSLVGWTAVTSAGFVPNNPVGGITGIGDPWVLKHNNKYYLYATSDTAVGFRVWESSDLVEWELKGLAYIYSPSLTKEGSWRPGVTDFWGPEVIFYQGRFYMTYCAKDVDGFRKIAIAVSDDPLGPFRDVRAPLFEEEASFIDGSIFIDDDGTPYLYFTREWTTNRVRGIPMSEIYVQRMSPDLLSLEGEPILALRPTEKWEMVSWSAGFVLVEGPCVIKHDGTYYLMYSANGYNWREYSIGYATAPSPTGPWTKYEGNPILAADLSIGVSGPGHNSVTRSPDDSELLIVYHIHTNPKRPSGDRSVCIDRMYFEDGVLIVDGPTMGLQSE